MGINTGVGSFSIKNKAGKSSNITHINSNIAKTETTNLTLDNNKVEVEEINLSKNKPEEQGLLEDVTSFVKDAGDAVGTALKKTGATVGTAAVSLVEGVGTLGEAIIDVGAIAGTAVASIATGLMDGGQALYGLATGEEWESVTKEMWENTKGFVSEKFVSGAFDDFYDNTGIGNFLKDNSVGFDTVRGVSSGIGYVAGIVALTVATGGVGAAALGGTAATGAAGATGTSMAAVAGLAGAGKGTENAWSEGATILEGLGTGAVTGAWEGLQFLIGSKIGNMELLATEGMKNKLINGLARVTLDGIDGGAEGLVQPLIDSIYKDGYKDENGNNIKFTDENIIERYKELFEDSGGFQNVAMQAAIGGASSAIGEVSNLRNHFNQNNKTATTNINNIDQSIKETTQSYDYDAYKIAENSKLDFVNKISKNGTNRQNNMTVQQVDFINNVNNIIARNGSVNIPLKNTKQITTEMLNSIDDLSKVNFTIDGAFNDVNGILKSKYNKPKYIKRRTYTGQETLAIVNKLDELTSKIDMSLPIKERAYQIYDVLATEIPVMRDYGNYASGHEVSASLRGLTANNVIGKAGLVCAGYSSAFKELCDRCNIPCDYIRGDAVMDPLKGKMPGKHAWNIVIDENNEIIPVDVTWRACGNEDWFGKSTKFAESHIASPDEMFKEYDQPIKPNFPENNMKTMYNSSSDSTINNIINITDSKYGKGSGIKAIERYAMTGDAKGITRTNNARNIIQQLNNSDIENYLLKNSPDKNYVYNQLSSIEHIIDQKYGIGKGRETLNNYIKTNNIKTITRDNNSRGKIQNIALEDIRTYLNKG